MTLSGENVGGRRAYEMGLVDHLVCAEKFDAETSVIVESYARNCSEGTMQSKILLKMAAYKESRQPQFSA
jgi:enoyl-CoA hydratase/carnithine racemase